MVRAAIVDDDPVFLDRIGDVLCCKGWEVLSCCRGEDVVSLVTEQRPDLILLNLGLQSGLSGRALLDHLALDPTTQSIPLIVYSGRTAIHRSLALPSVSSAGDLVVQGLVGVLEAIPTDWPRNGNGLASPAPLSIQLLGRFSVSVGPIPVEDSSWTLHKARTLVKLLALASQHRLHREEIMELLWPQASVTSSAQNLHTTLHMARHALEPALPPRSPSSYLHLQGDFLILDHLERDGTDAEAFQAAALRAQRSQDPDACEAALRLYRGELLPEDRNEGWSIGSRTSLARTRSELLLQLARLREQEGEPERAMAALQMVVEEDPAQEEAQAALMRLLASAGRQVQAVRQYHQLRAALREELDVEPAVETQALLESIQRR